MRARPRSAAALLIAVAAPLLGACGGGNDGTGETTAAQVHLSAGLSGPKLAAVTTAESYIEAFEDGDSERICGLTSLTEAALESCRSTLPDFNSAAQPRFELRSVQVHGRAATVRVAPRSGGSVIVFKLRKVGGEWKVLVTGLH